MSTVLVTGISGFVGSYVVLELLKQGYTVRGTVRLARLPAFQASALADKITLVPIDDVATGDFSEALKGVDAVIHVAAPLAGKAAPGEALQSAMEGTLNVLRQAVDAGIHKVVLTSSWGTTLDPSLEQSYEDKTFTSSDWGRATPEEVVSGKNNPMWVYLATKILAEKAAWEFADAHPELNLCTINPPFIYGPFAPGFPPPSNPQALGTNGLLYVPLTGVYPPPGFPPFFCDVRDVARAHVAALAKGGRGKRYLVSGGKFTWADAVAFIAREVPEVAGRLPEAPGEGSKVKLQLVDQERMGSGRIDVSEAERDLGMGVGEYVKWEKTVVETVRVAFDCRLFVFTQSS
ncbi:hypothetical protein Hypma_005979 [Hypsizygus marmoreus]|uniref:NAD-dependent epimerase/dehydratase domain-containing protein n=1 Tax=Hypsizygus marmoreus TaxID=39966 RepID=A0A369KDV5_HYPMA|nr:hypothetical protein Hypma_005979 [Hypsizygus marmoreus]